MICYSLNHEIRMDRINQYPQIYNQIMDSNNRCIIIVPITPDSKEYHAFDVESNARYPINWMSKSKCLRRINESHLLLYTEISDFWNRYNTRDINDILSQWHIKFNTSRIYPFLGKLYFIVATIVIMMIV